MLLAIEAGLKLLKTSTPECSEFRNPGVPIHLSPRNAQPSPRAVVAPLARPLRLGSLLRRKIYSRVFLDVQHTPIQGTLAKWYNTLPDKVP
jgi:hypothetical protein